MSLTASLRPERKVEFPFHYSPDGKMVHIVARLADAPGALASLLNLLVTKVDLIGTSSYAIEEGTAVFSGFGRLLSQSDDAHAVQTLASRSNTVQGCYAWESNAGLLVDRFHRGFRTPNGEAYLLVPTKALSFAFEALVQKFGSGGGTILYLQGFDYAKARWEVYGKMLGSNPAARLDELASVFTSLGWGVSEVTSDAPDRLLKYSVSDCFECSVPTKNGRRCEFLRGMAAGFAEGIYGYEVTSEETRCTQQGDPVCEFVVRPRERRLLR